MKTKIEQLRKWITESKRMVFFGGAGVSTESGIPDFRSSNGVYAALKAYGRPPEELLSHGFFVRHPDVFFDYYRKYLIRPEAKPNPAHYALARLEQQGKLTAVITQNIDELHQRAGSRNVLELHGSVYRNHCMEFRFGTGFQSEIELLSVADNFFHHRAHLVDLNRINNKVLGFITILLGCLFKAG